MAGHKKISHYDTELGDHSSEGLEFTLNKESYYLSQYSPIGRLLMKLSGKVTVFLSAVVVQVLLKSTFQESARKTKLKKH